MGGLPVDRRGFLRAGARAGAVLAGAGLMGGVALAGLGGCRGGAGAGRVVLYSSLDAHMLRPVLAAHRAEGGDRVALAGDTEATKTTGLVERLLAERDRPRGDVWWSSEPFATIRLAREGVVERPWRMVGRRARVVAINTARVAIDPDPARGVRHPRQFHEGLAELPVSRWRGRIGVARPRFGTTRGAIAYELVRRGEAAYAAWLELLKQREVRLYDGNSAVVRGLAQGEIDAGFTDSDDALIVMPQGWPIGILQGGGPDATPMMGIPTTIALIRGGPNAEGGRRLIEFLSSPRTERVLIESEARFAPLEESAGVGGSDPADVARRSRAFAGVVVPSDLEAIEAAIEPALAMWERVLGI